MRPMPLLLLLLLGLTGATGCVEEFSGAEIAMILRAVPFPEGQRPRGSHFELYGVVDRTPTWLGCFALGQHQPDQAASGSWVPGVGAIVSDCRDSERVLGNLEIPDPLKALRITGIRLRTPVNLADADQLFIGLKEEGDPSTTPVGPPLLQATLADRSRGTRGGAFTGAGIEPQPYLASGEITLIPAVDETF